jgi:hypothetical protein
MLLPILELESDPTSVGLLTSSQRLVCDFYCVMLYPCQHANVPERFRLLAVPAAAGAAAWL